MNQPLRIPSSNSRRLRLLLALPKLGIVLLLVAVLTLLWLLHRNEADVERSALIKDVLWLEQNLRFHFDGNEEQLQQLAQDMSNSTSQQKLFRLRAEHMMKNSPEIAQILWFDNKRRPIDAVPTSNIPDQEVDAFGPPVTAKAFDLAIRLCPNARPDIS